MDYLRPKLDHLKSSQFFQVFILLFQYHYSNHFSRFPCIYWHVILHSGAHLSNLLNLTCTGILRFGNLHWNCVILRIGNLQALTPIIVHSLSAHFRPCHRKSWSRRATVPPRSPRRTTPTLNAGQNLQKLRNYANWTVFHSKTTFEMVKLWPQIIHTNCGSILAWHTLK